jgi:ABC-type dipeptide/oligopeptide/nickel transport system ATPase component
MRRHVQLRGEPASPISPPSGCRFRTRCPLAAPVCAEQEPALLDQGGGQFVACHFPGMIETPAEVGRAWDVAPTGDSIVV